MQHLRAAAHILGRPVLALAQEIAGIRRCFAIYKKDDDRRSALRIAQKTIVEMMRGKEQSMDGKKRKQHVMDEQSLISARGARPEARLGQSCPAVAGRAVGGGGAGHAPPGPRNAPRGATETPPPLRYGPHRPGRKLGRALRPQALPHTLSAGLRQREAAGRTGAGSA